MSNSKGREYKYTLRLGSSSNYVSLFECITNISEMKVTQCRFTTASTGGLFLMIRIDGFNAFTYQKIGRAHV